MGDPSLTTWVAPRRSLQASVRDSMVTDVTGVDMVVRLCVIEMVKKEKEEIWNQPCFL